VSPYRAVICDWTTGDLYVGHIENSNSYQSLVHVVFYKSVNAGSTWGTKQAYSETEDDYRLIHGGGAITDSGGRIQWTWFDDDNTDYQINLVNDVAIPAPVAGGAPKTLMMMGVG
jgi:hypothetical protein